MREIQNIFVDPKKNSEFLLMKLSKKSEKILNIK